MATKKTASKMVRVYPSSQQKLFRLARPGRQTIAEIIEALLHKT